MKIRICAVFLIIGYLIGAHLIAPKFKYKPIPEEDITRKAEEYEKAQKLLSVGYIGNNIPERNIPEKRKEELRRSQERIIKQQEEAERKRLLELERERQRKLKIEQSRRKVAQQKSTASSHRSASIPATFTAYYPFNDRMQGGGITATGYNLYESIYYQGMRVIASDKSIPFYSILELNVEGYGVIRAIVLDRGGRIKGNLFDVAFPDKQTALDFGRKSGSYKIIRYGKGD